MMGFRLMFSVRKPILSDGMTQPPPSRPVG